VTGGPLRWFTAALVVLMVGLGLVEHSLACGPSVFWPLRELEAVCDSRRGQPVGPLRLDSFFDREGSGRWAEQFALPTAAQEFRRVSSRVLRRVKFKSPDCASAG